MSQAWKAAAGHAVPAAAPVSRGNGNDDEDLWDSDPLFTNVASEKDIRWGRQHPGVDLSQAQPQAQLDMAKLRAQVIANHQEKNAGSFSNIKATYGVKP